MSGYIQGPWTPEMMTQVQLKYSREHETAARKRKEFEESKHRRDHAGKFATKGETHEPADHEDEENASCPSCGGEGTSMGLLGNRHHLRCRDCGADYSHDLKSGDTKEHKPKKSGGGIKRPYGNREEGSRSFFTADDDTLDESDDVMDMSEDEEPKGLGDTVLGGAVKKAADWVRSKI